MPSLLMPRMSFGFRTVRSPVLPSMSVAPVSAYGTIAPTLRFVAPVTTVLVRPSPYSTVARSSLSAFGCFASVEIRATYMPSQEGRSIPFASVPAMCRRCARSSAGTETSTYSRSHDSGTRISI